MAAAATTSNDLPLFKQLNNVQDPAVVARLFSQGRRLVRDPHPTFVLLVGSPGAGKTSQLPFILQYAKIDKDVDEFYYASLDRLAEQVEPYRELTHRFHQTLVHRRQPAPLTNENIGLLGEIYLPMVKSTASNFSLAAKEQASMKKLDLSSTAAAAANVRMPMAAKPSRSSKKANASLGKRHAMNSRKSYQRGTKTRAKRAPKASAASTKLVSLADMVWSGLEYGIEHGYNIVYDTTFDGNFTKLKDHIMPMLEKHIDQVKYRIVVIHVTAPPEVIADRLRMRYRHMANHHEWIRAVDPRRADIFRKKNQEGYEKAEAYFTKDKLYDYLRGRKYTHHDFTFVKYDPLESQAASSSNSLGPQAASLGPQASTPSSLLASSLSAISLANKNTQNNQR